MKRGLQHGPEAGRAGWSDADSVYADDLAVVTTVETIKELESRTNRTVRKSAGGAVENGSSDSGRTKKGQGQIEMAKKYCHFYLKLSYL